MRDPAGRGIKASVRAVAFVAAFAALLIAAPAAGAFSLSPFAAKPANDDAGANSRFSVDFDVQQSSAQLKRLVIHLPPGLVGNPLAAPTCTEQRLNADDCPAASDVGDISNTVKVQGIPLPVTAGGNIYNVVPRSGEPARFGFVLTTSGNLLPPIILQSPASLRQSDFGLDTTLDDIPRTVSGLSIDITAVSLTLQGRVGTPPQGFMRNPTSCGSHDVGYDAAAYSGQTASGSTTFTTDNCGALPFAPKFGARIRQLSPDLADPIELTTSISQTIEEAGLKEAVVTLPTDIIGNGPALAVQCEATAFDVGACPADTRVGVATAASPLQEKPLAGDVYLVKPVTPSPFPDLGVDLEGGLALKVKGSISAVAVPSGLQIVVTFAGLPDIPLSDFSLTFAGGSGGLNVAGRDPCQPPPFIFGADFTSHSGKARHVDSAAKASCKGGGAGRPKARVGIAKLRSGKPRLKIRLRAGSAQIRKARVRLPRGLEVGAKRRLRNGAHVTGGSVRGHGRTLSLKAKGGGVNRLRIRLAKGAVKARKGIRAKRLKRFTIKVADSNGNRTKLSVRAAR